MEIKVVGIKFKPVGKIYYFDPKNLDLKNDQGVIVETDRGLEYGEVVLVDKKVPKEDIVGKLKAVLRVATDKDYEVLEKNNKKAIESAKIASNLMEQHKLEMKIIDSEYTFEGNKVIFTFTAENRVDFRQLVRELASKLKARIELRQVGARDASKIIGGLGPCGRVICCANHMREFNKVSIKMAKTQGLALNPTKINGVCGRLMCCLSYENEYYAEISKKMPKIGKKVITPDGEGIAIYNNLLKQLVTVRFLDEKGAPTTNEYPASDVKRKEIPQIQNKPKNKENNHSPKKLNNDEMKPQGKTQNKPQQDSKNKLQPNKIQHTKKV